MLALLALLVVLEMLIGVVRSGWVILILSILILAGLIGGAAYLWNRHRHDHSAW